MTTQLTEHAKTILRAIADGKRIQQSFGPQGEVWRNMKTDDALRYLRMNNDEYLRIAPETCSINGVVFAAPEDGGYLLLVDDKCADGNAFVVKFKSQNDRDNALLAIRDALNGVTKS
jgi:hypothetical protein